MGSQLQDPEKTVEDDHLEFLPNDARKNEARHTGKEPTSPLGIQSMRYWRKVNSRGQEILRR
jgi:hypothetical protein